MQTQPRFSLFRLVLFPYNGRERLTLRQSLRVIIVWALFFTAPMMFCTLGAILLSSASLTRALVLLLVVFLSGLVIFGLTAWVVVWMNNRSAQINAEQNNTKTNSTSGGRYGS